LPKDRQIVVVCKAGGRSAQVTAFLRQYGFDAVNLEGGMLSWAESGFPFNDENGLPGTVV
jgi:rhodanese-related sulfurtransferase